MNKIIYANSRKSRDPPHFFSGDETITRLYTSKASDIRMRTRKKNESGILNQNICGSNQGYSTWKEDDPQGNGFTYCNTAYTGALYNFGSSFREKDIGNLIWLMFQSGDYFRFRNLELIADSHFGHLTPIIFLKSWGVFSTVSFNAHSRVGVQGIKELSKQELDKNQVQNIIDEKSQKQSATQVFDPYASPSSSDSEDVRAKENLRARKMTGIKFFEEFLKIEPKGTYRVWESEYDLPTGRKASIYLHAINDAKPVYRISTKHAALPKKSVMMIGTDKKCGKKVKSAVDTSPAHASFRKFMGFNDQSDAKRSFIGLSSRYYKMWPKHLVAKTLEDAIINAYLNYLLDPLCPIETWPTFLYCLVDEFLVVGENMRTQTTNPIYQRSFPRKSKRPRPGSDKVLQQGTQCRGGVLVKSIKLLHRDKRTQMCIFCGRSKARYKCRSCGAHLCLQFPNESEGLSFPRNGPPCFLRYHGIEKYN